MSFIFQFQQKRKLFVQLNNAALKQELSYAREKIKKKVLNKRRKKSNSRKGRNKGKNHKGKTITVKENPKNSCTGNNENGFESISKPFSYSPILWFPKI